MVNLIDLVFKWVTMLTFNPDSLSLELVLEQSPIAEYLTTNSIAENLKIQSHDDVNSDWNRRHFLLLSFAFFSLFPVSPLLHTLVLCCMHQDGEGSRF